MKKKSYFELMILAFVILLGLLLRLHAYLVNHPLFVDEVLMQIAIVNQSYSKLFIPDPITHVIPFLYLFSIKFLLSLFGQNIFVLRLIPFLTSVASVGVFYLVCRNVFERFWVRVLALLLFCINFQLLFYTQFMRPYSISIFLTLLIILTALSLEIRKINLKQAFGLGLLSSIAFCFSFPAVFVVAGVSAVYLLFSREFKKIFVFLLPFITTVTLYFLTSLHIAKTDKYLETAWAEGFNLFHCHIYQLNYDFLFTYYGFPLIFAFLFILGIVLAYKNDKFKTLIVISPLVVAILSALLKIYSLQERLAIFLIPVFLIFIVMPLDKIKIQKKVLNIAIIGISLAFFANYIFNFTRSFVIQLNSYKNPDVIALTEIIKSEKANDEHVYALYSPGNSYLSYKITNELPQPNICVVFLDFLEWRNLFTPFPDKTSWFLFVEDNNTPYFSSILNDYVDWLYKTSKVEKDIKLKSARLIKLKYLCSKIK